MNRRQFFGALAAAPVVVKAKPATVGRPAGLTSGIALRMHMDTEDAKQRICADAFEARMSEFARLMATMPAPLMVNIGGEDE